MYGGTESRPADPRSARRVEAPDASTFDADEDEIVGELEKAEARRVSEG